MTLRQSIFQAREMLLDYHENKLDSARHEMVKKVLASDVETERALNQIKKGLDFAKLLSQAKLNENFGEQLKKSENISSLITHYSRFKNWSQAFRTSTYAILGCLFIVVIVMSLPRNTLMKFKLRQKASQEIVLSQVAKNQDLGTESDDPEKRDAQAVIAQNLPTDTDEDDASDAAGTDASGDEHAEPIIIPPTPPPTRASAKAEKLAAAAIQKEESTEEGDESGEKQTASDISSDRKTGGFVYRGTMKIDELDERSPLIAQQIADLGGRKAGEVELGWRKDNKGSYYHFSMPEENYDKLLDYLHGFGPVRFSKDSHPRVMPQGEIRIILWVEHKNE